MYDKIYVLDTNIILDSVDNLIALSENKKNLLVVTETVISELDKFKVGDDNINYQAREFHRILDHSHFNYITMGVTHPTSYPLYTNENFELLILPDSSSNPLSADDKILETINIHLEKLRHVVTYHERIILITNDIIMKIKAQVKNIRVQSLYRNKTIVSDFTKQYNYNECFPNKSVFTKEELENILGEQIPDRYSYITIIEYTGKPFYLLRENGHFRIIDPERKEYIHNIKPKNLEQHILLQMCLSDNTDIVVVNGIAGTGKTLMLLLASLQLIDKGKYDKITYLRKTVISGDKLDEIGFLPGNKDEKLKGYTYPLRDNIETIIKTKFKKKNKNRMTKDELEQKIEAFENEYNINYEYQGHLRGRTLDGIIIIDECQNNSIDDLITILSRIKEGSRVFICGSIKQIDNPYLNKYNNSLTFMMNQIGTQSPVRIKGMNLSKVERGPITEWIEKITQK